MNYPNKYRQFFEDLVTGLAIDCPEWPDLAIQQAWYGEGRQVLGKQRSSAEYPVLWVERADYEFVYQGGGAAFAKTLQGAFMVLMNAPADDYPRQNDNDDKCMRLAEFILRDMLQRLYPEDRAKADAALAGAAFQLGSVLPCEAVAGSYEDNLNGRRVTFTLRGIQIPILCC
jgi:hypothetical protein